MIDVRNFKKEYNGVLAVDTISFSVKKGEVFALLGPNGAGKTTTIKAILGLIKYHGDITINGLTINDKGKEIKKILGYLPETVSFYDNLTAVQTLKFFAELKGIKDQDIMGLLKEVGLEDDANRKVGNYSKGMLQRLGLAQSLLGNAQILILDEPTSGLDAVGAYDVRKKIKKLSETGNTILLCSHILSEVQEVCDQVAILNKGKIMAIDTVDNLSKKLRIQPKLKIKIEDITDEIVKQITKIKSVKNVKVDGDMLEVTCPPTTKLAVINAIEKAGLQISDFSTVEPSLEEVFMKMVSKNE
jgi:ABC-type multidrug transport system ATPase subunit